MNYIEKWTENLLLSQAMTLSSTVHVEGIRKAHLGPRMEFGRVEFIIEPADGFDVSVEVANVDENTEYKWYIEWAIFGFLDVVMVGAPYPYKKLKLRVVGVEIDPIDSSQMAFRLAGRDAGRKFLEEQKR